MELVVRLLRAGHGGVQLAELPHSGRMVGRGAGALERLALGGHLRQVTHSACLARERARGRVGLA